MFDRLGLRVVAARLISRTGGEAAFFVGIWGKAAYEFEASPAALAVLMASLGIAGLAGSSVAGMLIDRHGPKRVLIVSEVLFVPAALAGAFVVTYPQLVAVAFFIGLIGAPAFTAIASFPPFLTDDPHRLARINAAVETAGMAALITGTASGALLAEFVSLDSIFVFDALTSIVAAALVLPVALRTLGNPSTGAGGGVQEIREGFAFVYRHRRLRFYVLIGTSVWLIFGLFSALEPLFYRDVLGTGPEAIGWVNTIFGCGLVAGTFLATRLPERVRGARGVVGLVALNGVGSLIYVGTESLAVVVVGAIVWGTVIGLFAPVVRTMIHLNSPESIVGRVMGTTQVHTESAKLVPLLIAPWLAAVLGVQATLAGSGLVLAVIAVLVWRPAADLDRTRDRPVPRVEPTAVEDPLSPTP